jgi:hypothetical protein
MAEGMIESIKVILQAITSKFAQGMSSASKSLKQFGKNMGDFGTVMKAPMSRFRVLNGQMNEMRTTGGRLAFRVRELTHGMRGFRMEMLGVMFFGMMLQRTFLNLLQPVMDAYGVFDLFRIMLLVLFLPVMEMIFPMLLKMMEWFMNLPEPVQKAIGVLVLVGVAIGTLLSLVGMFALGLGSLIQAFPSLGIAVKGLGALFAGLSAPVIAVIAVIALLLVGMYLAWKENFLGMRAIVATFIDGIKQFFSGLIDIVKGVFNIIKGILTGDFDTFIKGIKQLFGGLWDTLVGGVKIAFGIITGIIVGALEILVNFVNLILKFGSAIGNFLSGKGFVTEGAVQIPTGKGAGATSVTNQGSVNITNNFSGFTSDELQKQLDSRDRTIVSEVRRQTK